MTGTSLQAAADTAAMRAESDQLNASVREDNRALYERERRARQLAYEADLIDDAEMAEAEWRGACCLLDRLDDARADALAVKRGAEDRRDDDQRRQERREAELQKAEADDAPGERQEDLAARVLQLYKKAAVSQKVFDEKTRLHAAAKAARDAQVARVAALYAEHAEAARKVANPGTAPGMPMLAPGVARMSDLGLEERQYILAATIMVGNLRSDPAPAVPSEEAILKDQTRWRMLKTGRGAGVIIPPRMS